MFTVILPFFKFCLNFRSVTNFSLLGMELYTFTYLYGKKLARTLVLGTILVEMGAEDLVPILNILFIGMGCLEQIYFCMIFN